MSENTINNEVVFYISPKGNDKWSGKLAEPNESGTDGPFATLAKARDTLRELKKSGNLAWPVKVWLRGGVYPISHPIVFNCEDSWPVTYCAWPGETPILDGGKRITGWTKEKLDNELEAWVTTIPDVAQGKWYFRQLIVNGEIRNRTRLPEQGHYRIKSVPGKDLSVDLFDGSDTFEYNNHDIKNWKNINNIDVVVLHYWVEERMPIEHVNEMQKTVKCKYHSSFALKDDNGKEYAKYYIENVFEALSRPGEWYLDRKTGKIYYIPMPGEDIDEVEISAPVTEQALILEGSAIEDKFVEYIKFKGIEIRNTGWHHKTRRKEWGLDNKDIFSDIIYAGEVQASLNVPGVIFLKYARYCSIENCRLRNIGYYGIEISDGCKNINVVGNEIYNAGAGGVKLNGGDIFDHKSKRTRNNRVTDNHIHYCGRVFHSAVGVLCAHSSDNEISHNHIHHLHYTGISCGWVWGYRENNLGNNKIEKNYIHHIGTGILSDMGGIYLLGVQPGTVVRGNIIHDIEKCNYGGWAIYTDEGSSHIIIENNICYRMASTGFFQHYGRENIVRNNIFAFGREALVSYGRSEEHNGFTFERNILITNNSPVFLEGYGMKFKDKSFISDLNLIWDISGKEPFFKGKADYTLEEWKSLFGQDLHSIVADPLFKDCINGDFTLDDKSPAFKIGFKPIDINGTGPRIIPFISP
ncbi:MAG: right-handed parallel beta-helix repeat-containing protein [Firmicutes bacterium]|nr:right-handed parallel beta-helix repeat-containing protein [Bacillota bacterium]